MDIQLNEIEVRILGVLVEKEITTPDYYPLSLNALRNACNQRSNREPVMDLNESTVREGLDNLNRKGLAGPVSTAESRVTKYAHRLQEVFNFSRRETAVLCVLFLRGPQTPGELRVHTERMYRFDDLATVESTLHHLMERQPPLVKKLARPPGTKEARYAHLLAGDVETWDAGSQSALSSGVVYPDDERLARLESEVATLQEQLAELRQQFADFRKQFE
jgi:uncharacterized protein YceH (UPF0502 family)